MRLVASPSRALVGEFGDRARRSRVEIGDTKEQSLFLPQFKTMHWSNECNFSARLLDADFAAGAVREAGDAVEWASADGRIARFYSLPSDAEKEDGGFEFEVVLPAPPASNELRFSIRSKGLNFYRQGALTDRELRLGALRPEHVLGSYAAYHATQRHNYGARVHYRTGKAFHLYRPFAIDSAGHRVWCELHINSATSEMTITVPPDFLASAVYPVIVDPTYGYTSQGASEHATDDYMWAHNAGSFGGTNNSTITGGACYGRRASGSGSSTIELGLYSDNAGDPNARLAVISASVAIDGTVSLRTVSDTDAFALQNGTTYWIGLACSLGGGWRVAYDTGGTAAAFQQGTTLPDPFAPEGSIDWFISSYLDVADPAGGGGLSVPIAQYYHNHLNG